MTKIRIAPYKEYTDFALANAYYNRIQYMTEDEIDNQLAYMERMERKQKREAERKQKLTYKLFHKVACACGIM